MSAQRGFRAQFQEAVRAFREHYESYAEEARARLNGLFDPADYPPAHEIAGKFDFDIGYMPLPDGQDFRVSLGEAKESRIRAAIEERVRKATGEAMRDLWTRVYRAVSHMSERLGAYRTDPATGKVENCFRDSLVGNLRPGRRVRTRTLTGARASRPAPGRRDPRPCTTGSRTGPFGETVQICEAG